MSKAHGGSPPVTEEQKARALSAWEAAGRNARQAAEDTGMKESTFKYHLRKAKVTHTAEENLAPLIPDGQKLRGISTLYDKDNNVVQTWIKTNENLNRQLDIIKETVEAMKADIPKEKPSIFKGEAIEDLLSLYILTDYHIGQMSWEAECGEKWDTERACDFLVAWFEKAISAAPASKVGILCQLGDFLHYDSMQAVTPTSRHLLDTDTRYANIVNSAIKALRRVINLMLKKHEHVHIINAEGNHDMASSIWLRALFADKYENEKRISVDNTHAPYYKYEWGNVGLYFHHGHLQKFKEVSKTFVGMDREMFGRTKFSYGHTGHLHHEESKEDQLMLTRQHRTLAAKDAYSTRGGYIAQRSASVITYSRKFGQVSEASITPEMVR